MPDNNITTYVQNGETLSLYANMYGCSVDDIKGANNISCEKIKEGQKLVIPIGQPPQKNTEAKSVLDKKLAYFDNLIEETHLKLYDPKLKPNEREALEDEYIKLKNMKKERDGVAQFTKSGNGINLVLEIKENISVAEFRKLFPECTKNFYEYASETKQLEFIQGQGFQADPADVILYKGKTFMIKSQQYARDSGDGFWRSLWKTVGGRLD